MTAGTQVRGAAEQAEGSALVDKGARLGLAARTLVWTTIALLALAVAAGNSAKPDQSGALATLGNNPLGTVLLVATAVGFAAYGLYRVLTATVGHRDQPPGRARWLRRAQSAAEAVLYLAAAVTTARFVLGRGADSEKQTDATTARLMALPGGRWLVGLVGIVVVVVGAVMAYRAVRERHAADLDPARASRRLRRAAVAVGVVGLAGRGVVIALVGGFLVDAAARFDPQQAKGLDATLQTVAQQPFGRGLLLLAALALLAFGVWSLAETLWRDV